MQINGPVHKCVYISLPNKAPSFRYSDMKCECMRWSQKSQQHCKNTHDKSKVGTNEKSKNTLAPAYANIWIKERFRFSRFSDRLPLSKKVYYTWKRHVLIYKVWNTHTSVWKVRRAARVALAENRPYTFLRAKRGFAERTTVGS